MSAAESKSTSGNMLAAVTLGSIFTEFGRRREQEKTSAWRWLQKSLAENAALLCPTAVSLKDFIAAIANIEDFLKGTSTSAAKSPNEELLDWLNGNDSAGPAPTKKGAPIQ
jgi:hypothetical protein